MAVNFYHFSKDPGTPHFQSVWIRLTQLNNCLSYLVPFSCCGANTSVIYNYNGCTINVCDIQKNVILFGHVDGIFVYTTFDLLWKISYLNCIYLLQLVVITQSVETRPFQTLHLVGLDRCLVSIT